MTQQDALLRMCGQHAMLSRLLNLVLVAAVAFLSVTARAQEIANLLQKAEAGDAKAQFDLGSAYLQGSGVPLNHSAGIEWIRKAANKGYAGAEVTLALFCEKGVLRDVPGFDHPDPHEAAKWFRKAAQQQGKDAKHAKTAQDDLSDMLSRGLISKQEANWTAAENTPPAGQSGDHTKSRSFSLAEVESGLTGGITSKRMVTLVSTYGVDFPLTTNTRKRLTDDGADDNLLATISASRH